MPTTGKGAIKTAAIAVEHAQPARRLTIKAVVSL